ncbi:MAG: acyl-CoA thioesterase [Chitinophagales bacterium]|nr:acyl-CoA thioesterase [Chitinophagales bacterium]
MLLLSAFKYSRSIEVRWRDIDYLRHVNNAVYLSYFEIARSSYLNDLFDWNWAEHGIVLARASVDYKIPVLLTDRPKIYVRCTAIGTKSFTLEYAISIERNGKEVLAVRSESVLVMYHYTTEKTFSVPDEIRQKISAHEGVAF